MAKARVSEGRSEERKEKKTVKKKKEAKAAKAKKPEKPKAKPVLKRKVEEKPEKVKARVSEELEKPGVVEKAENPWQILRWAKLTEKAIAQVEQENKLIFIVKSGAKREKIKAAVEQAFAVKVAKVNMLIDRKGQKKAFVKLAPEHSALDIATKLGMM